jgi:hypothetical protein
MAWQLKHMLPLLLWTFKNAVKVMVKMQEVERDYPGT